jgi:hypothetical protein
MHSDGLGLGRPARPTRKRRSSSGHIGDLVDKAEKVGEDTAVGGALGATIGTAIFPGIGSAAGTAIGTAAGAIYGAIDNFGGDAVKFLGLNPPAFSEEKYEWQRNQCRKGGGTPTPGVAPDAYGGCTYGEGAVSGGDVPFPGSWNGNVIDQAVYDAAKAELAAKAQAAADATQLPSPLAPAIALQRLSPSSLTAIKRAMDARAEASRAQLRATLLSHPNVLRAMGPAATTAKKAPTTIRATPPSAPVSTTTKVVAAAGGVGALGLLAWLVLA